MLGILNTVQSKGSAFFQFIKEGLVMANRFLTPPSLSHPAQGSAEFDGSSDYIETTLTPSEFPSSAFTFSAWANTDTNTSFKSILGADTGIATTYGSFYFQISNFGYWRLNLTNSIGNQFIAQDSVQAQTNKWYYVTGVFDGSSVKIYKDGSLIATTAFTGTLAAPNTNTLIGAAYFQNNIVDFWEGNLANVAIWNRALSSDEINSVMWKGYEALNTSEKNGLQAWYKLEESELLSGDDTATLETYAAAKGLTFEGKTCLQNALNAFPDITDARLYSANYDIRVSADGGSIEALSCVETELNALL